MRYLSPAQSATLKPYVKGGILDTSDSGTAAIAATLGIQPGRYNVARYVVSAEPNKRTGKVSTNAGKKGITLDPADDTTELSLRAASAAAAAARWDDKAWIKGQRAAARAKAQDAAAALDRAARAASGKPGKGTPVKG